MSCPVAVLVLGVGTGASAEAADPQNPGGLYAELRAPGERFGLGGEPELAMRWQNPASESPAGKKPPTPVLAGFLSAVVPGSGQLLQGDQRGWIYLGVEAAAWFSYFALHDAGSQAEVDYKEYADAHWDWQRYETVPVCGDGLGPVDFDQESEALRDAYANSPDSFYQDIGFNTVYACGWEAQSQRSMYQSMINDSDQLYSAAKWVVGAVVLNHVVSAIDAAKSASTKQKSWLQSLQVAPAPDGLRVELGRTF